jgi:integrase
MLPKSVHEAAKRTLPRANLRRKPMTLEIIQDLCAKYPPSTTDLYHLRTLTLITIGFAGFFRFDELSHIKRSDIVLFDTHVSIFVEKSKTDKYRDGAWVVISRSGDITCPVSMLERYLMLCEFKEGSDQFIFRSITKLANGYKLRDKNAPISYTRAREVFLEILKDAVPDASRYGLHSLRSGGATLVANKGIPDRLLKKHGRWVSDKAKDSYISETLADRLKVSQSLGL